MASRVDSLHGLENQAQTQPAQADNRYPSLSPLTADTGGWYSVGDQEKY
jgi:hypothetical protein